MPAGIFAVPAWIDESMLLKVHTVKIRKINSGRGWKHSLWIKCIFKDPLARRLFWYENHSVRIKKIGKLPEKKLKEVKKLSSVRNFCRVKRSVWCFNKSWSCRWILLLDGSWVGWKFSSLAVALKSVHYAWQLALAVLCSWNPASLTGVVEREKSLGQYMPCWLLIIEAEAVLALQRIFWNSWYGKYPTRWSVNHYQGFPTVLDWACRLFLKSCGQHGEWICHASRWN